MDINELVSIIVPIYKIQYNLLRDTITSLINQTYNNVEIILVDDGSPDKCGNICDEFAKSNRKIKVIHTKNSGVSHARNTGIMESKGKYIVFVDGDDTVPDYAIISMLRVMKNSNCDLLIGNFTIKGSEVAYNNEIHQYIDSGDLLKIQKSFIEAPKLNNHRYSGAPWGKMYKRNIIIKNNCFFDESLPRSQDNEFNFRYMLYVNKVTYLNTVIYEYCVRDDSAVKKYWPKAIDNADILLKKLKEDIAAIDECEQYEDAYSGFCYIKLLDILHTNLVHPENKEPLKMKIELLRELAESTTYSCIFNQKMLPRGKYKNIIFKLLKRKRYLIIFYVAKLRFVIKKNST